MAARSVAASLRLGGAGCCHGQSAGRVLIIGRSGRILPAGGAFERSAGGPGASGEVAKRKGDSLVTWRSTRARAGVSLGYRRHHRRFDQRSGGGLAGGSWLVRCFARPMNMAEWLEEKIRKYWRPGGGERAAADSHCGDSSSGDLKLGLPERVVNKGDAFPSTLAVETFTAVTGCWLSDETQFPPGPHRLQPSVETIVRSGFARFGAGRAGESGILIEFAVTRDWPPRTSWFPIGQTKGKAVLPLGRALSQPVRWPLKRVLGRIKSRHWS